MFGIRASSPRHHSRTVPPRAPPLPRTPPPSLFLLFGLPTSRPALKVLGPPAACLDMPSLPLAGLGTDFPLPADPPPKPSAVACQWCPASEISLDTGRLARARSPHRLPQLALQSSWLLPIGLGERVQR